MAATSPVEHHREISVIAADVGDQVRVAARSADVADIDAWWARTGPGLERIVQRGFAATATLAGRYLATAAVLNGFTLEPVQVAFDVAQIATSLRVTGPVAFKKNIRRGGDPDRARVVMSKQLAGSANRLTMAGSRETFAATADESDVLIGYRRVAQSGACKFCEMLATRGAAYLSRTSAQRVVGRGNSPRPRGRREIGEKFHDNCVIGSTVVRGPAVELAYRRWYEGELVIVGLASGEELAVTPNHPVLTDRGWVAAGELSESDHLAHRTAAEPNELGVPHEHQMPSAIQDVWSSCGMDRLRSMPVAPENFHGDGAGTKGHVDVVAPDRFLPGVLDLELVQGGTEASGAGAGPTAVLDGFPPLSDTLAMLLRLTPASCRCMCRLDLGSPLRGRQLRLMEDVGFPNRPTLNASIGQPPSDYRAGDIETDSDRLLRGTLLVDRHDLRHVDGRVDTPVTRPFGPGPRFDPPPLEGCRDRAVIEADLGRRLLERLAGKVQLGRPVKLRRVEWSGHVYNLQTAEGWYAANSVVVSNCNCRVEEIWDSGRVVDVTEPGTTTTPAIEPTDVEPTETTETEMTPVERVEAARIRFRESTRPPLTDRVTRDAEGNLVPTEVTLAREGLRQDVGAAADSAIAQRLADRGIRTEAEIKRQIEDVIPRRNEAELRWLEWSGRGKAKARQEFEALELELMDLRNEAFDARVRYRREWQAELDSVLGDMGIAQGGVPAQAVASNLSGVEAGLRGRIEQALDRFPSEWLQRSTGRDAFEVIAEDPRAFMRRAGVLRPAQMNLAPTESVAVIAHEFAHQVENLSLDIRESEWALYWRRAGGEKAARLNVLIPGSGYRDDELSRPDEWPDPYQGKPYDGAKPGSNYELLSMAVENYLAPVSSWQGGTANKFWEDDDMRTWFLGVLLTG